MILGAEKLEGRSGHDVGRALLAQMYRAQTGQALPPIALTDRGKPYFVSGALHFSISHTKDHVFCALSQSPIGIDAEETDRPIALALADRILSDSEKRRFEASTDPRGALLRLWVLKEAYAKATGRGWGNYLGDTDFDPNDPRVTVKDSCYVAVIEL